ncbi:hypothetical protein BIU95_17120 [Curtobacterium sp. MCBA15_007]|nr:hypothetical protein BIU95_17120 [Curtobacterium sp. MCBA15_007]
MSKPHVRRVRHDGVNWLGFQRKEISGANLRREQIGRKACPLDGLRIEFRADPRHTLQAEFFGLLIHRDYKRSITETWFEKASSSPPE